MPSHTVAPGDCFDSIAKQHGFFNYLTIFKHGANAQLCGDSTDPNTLIEGKTVDVPDKVLKKVALKLDGEQRFVIDRRKTRMRVVVADAAGKACKMAACKLVVGGVEVVKAADFEGLVDADIDPADKAGTLAVKLAPIKALAPKPPPKPVPSGPQPAPTAPPHPPKIVADEFTDVREPLDDKPIELVWALKVGHLEAVSTLRGALQRLNNLGATTPDPATTLAEDDKTKRIVKSYQHHKGKPKEQRSGMVADVRELLQSDHDKM
jgi:hypothetical protein